MNHTKKHPIPLTATLFILLIAFMHFSCKNNEEETRKYRNWVSGNLSQYTVDSLESDTWFSVQVSTKRSPNESWKTIVYIVAEKFSLELIDKETYYIRSDWKTERYTPSGPSGWCVSLRSGLFCRYSEYEKTFKIKFNSQVWWWNDWAPSKYISKEDYALLEEIRGRISG